MAYQMMKLTTHIKYERDFHKTWEEVAVAVSQSIKALTDAGFTPNAKGMTMVDGYDQRSNHDIVIVSVEGHKV